MTEKEAMKLALEALEYIYEGANNQGPHTGISWRCVSNKAEPAITALREALANSALDKMAENARELGLDYEPAQQKQKRWAVFCQGCRKEWSVSYPHPGKSICADCDDKLAQCDASQRPAQQQEPVADEVRCPECGYLTKHTEHIGCLRKQLNAINAFEQRNFAIVNMDKFPPAQRTWVGLTDEEKRQIFEREDYQGWLDYINAIEAKLKEKNNV